MLSPAGTNSLAVTFIWANGFVDEAALVAAGSAASEAVAFDGSLFCV